MELHLSAPNEAGLETYREALRKQDKKYIPAEDSSNMEGSV